MVHTAEILSNKTLEGTLEERVATIRDNMQEATESFIANLIESRLEGINKNLIESLEK
jgi:uncharacterized MAPEG superfamily protein